LNEPAVLLRYARLVVLPTRLLIDYGLPQPATLAAAAPAGLAVIAVLGACIWTWRYSPPVGFLGTWVFVTLAPTSSLIPIATEVGAERRLYLPLAAVVAMGAMLMARVMNTPVGSSARHRWAAVAMLAAVAVPLTALTVRRNAEYRDPLVLWRTQVERLPHARAHFSLAGELEKRGDLAGAEREWVAAVPGYPQAHYSLALLQRRQGRIGEALANMRAFVIRLPWHERVPDAYAVMGDGLLQQHRFSDAVQALNEALKRQPSNAVFRRRLAMAYNLRALDDVRQQHTDDAARDFAHAVSLTPDDADMRENLGNALAAAGQLEPAAAQYQQAVRLAPQKASARSGLAVVLVALGRRGEAEAQMRRALELAPNDPRVRGDAAVAMRLRRAPRG
jgi:tetratricopeptide (TPR) repeat protein